jgi:hypothetical protein
LEANEFLYLYEIVNTNGMQIIALSFLLDKDSHPYISEVGAASDSPGAVSAAGDAINWVPLLMPGMSDVLYVISDADPTLGMVQIVSGVGGNNPNTDPQILVPDAPNGNGESNQIPEPSTLLLVATALIGVAGIRRFCARK